MGPMALTVEAMNTALTARLPVMLQPHAPHESLALLAPLQPHSAAFSHIQPSTTAVHGLVTDTRAARHVFPRVCFPSRVSTAHVSTVHACIYPVPSALPSPANDAYNQPISGGQGTALFFNTHPHNEVANEARKPYLPSSMTTIVK